jgi:hypothetical protein
MRTRQRNGYVMGRYGADGCVMSAYVTGSHGTGGYGMSRCGVAGSRRRSRFDERRCPKERR